MTDKLTKNIWLSPELKEKYMEDFENKVLKCKHPAWTLEEEVRPFLIRINSNPEIQTLYSAFYKRNSSTYIDGEFNSFPVSYLRIAYSLSLAPAVNKKCESFMANHGEHEDAWTSFESSLPRDNCNYRGRESSINLGCLNDPEYFRIDCIECKIVSPDRKVHLGFWQEISDLLMHL